MKKIILAVMLSILMITSIFAVSVEIGNGVGATTNTNSMPFNGYYGYSWSHFILPGDAITNAVDITEIEFNVSNSPSNYTRDNQIVYMRLTTETTVTTDFTANPGDNGYTEVYNGSVTWNGGGWQGIDLTTPFSYDGTSNLEIIWENRHGQWQTGYPLFYKTDAPGAGVYNRNDSAFPTGAGTQANFYPNTRITWPEEGEPTAPVLVSPAQNAVNVAIDADLTWTTGDNTVYSVLYLADNIGFTGATIVNPATSPYSASLANGTTYFWKVKAVGPTNIEATSVVRSFTTQFLPITEFPWVESFEGDEPNWTILDNNDDGDMWDTNYTSNAYEGSESAVIYTDFNAGDNDDYLISPQFTLTGNQRLKFWYRVQGASEPNDFRVVLSTTGIEPADFTNIILPLTECSNTTYLEQTIDLSEYSGNCYFAFHVPPGGLDGWRLYIDYVTVEEIPEGALVQITPDGHDFGELFIGYQATQTFTVANNGIEATTITGIDVPAGYTRETSVEIPLTLEPNNSFVVTVTFSPVNEMVYSGNLRVKQPMPGNPFATINTDAALTGAGIPIPEGATCQNPIPLTFPAVDVTGNTGDYINDYSSSWITPSSNYLNGDDVVYQFTLDNTRILNGSITTSQSWMGAFILQEEPNEENPAPVILSKTSSSGSTLTYSNEMLDAGTYFLIISSWPSPQSIDYTINLTADPLPAPGVATSPSPADEAIDQPTALTLGWSNAAYTETIDLWFGEAGGRSMELLLDNVTKVNQHEVTDLDPNTTYNWKVVNRNYSGETLADDVITWSFTTVGSAPEAVAYTAPADEATNVAKTGNLSWSAATGADGYLVYLSDDNTFTGVIPVDQTARTYAYSGDYNTTYYWKVIPYNVVGQPTEGIEVWSFTTMASPFPEADIVFDGTRSLTNNLPMYAYYNYSISQSIYYQSELNIEDVAITSISYLYSKNSAWSETIEIFMKHTDKDVFANTTDWEIDDFTHVYSGSIAVNTTESIVPINLDNPFVYNGTDNLVVLFFATDAECVSSSDNFYSYSVTGNRSLVRYSDSDRYFDDFPSINATGYLRAYLPVTGFNYQELTEEPQFNVSAESLTFAEAYAHTESAPQTLSVSNLGLGVLGINSLILTGTNADQFQLTDGNEYPVNLGAGDNMSVSVVYAPTNAGEHTAEIQITDDQGRAVRINSTAGNREMYSVTLTGSCVDPTIYALPFTEGFEENNVHDSEDVYLWSQVSEAGTQAWVINKTNTNYGRTPRSGEYNATLRYSNTDWLMRPIELVGGQSYDVELYARQNTTIAANATVGIYYGTEATVASMEEITGQIGVIDGDYQLIDGTFTPATSGIYHIGIKGAVTGAPWYLNIDDIAIRETPTTPVADISTTHLNFGTVFANESMSEEISIRNVGVGTLNISAIEIDGLNADEFSYSTEDGASMALTQGQSLTVTVQFTPVSEGDKEATLQIIDDQGRTFRLNSATRTTNNNRNVNEVILTGSCVDPTIYTLPFTEGFEENNVHNSGDVYMWSQISESGSDPWIINETHTDYNRTPRTGSFNVSLKYGNTDWLMRPIELVGGQEYAIELYTRQDATSGATVGIYYGTEATTASMESITGDIAVTNGEYQLIDGTFTPATSGIYHIGIKGSATYAPWYISVDDISISQVGAITLAIPENVTMTSTESGLIITWDPVEGANSYIIYATDRRDGDYEIIDTVSETSYTPDGVDRVKLFKIKASPESINSITGFSRRGRN